MSDVTSESGAPINTTEADENRTTTEGSPRQTVKLMPDEREIGPFFPSGMNAVEAAFAGATADMSDADKEKLGIGGGGEAKTDDTGSDKELPPGLTGQGQMTPGSVPTSTTPEGEPVVDNAPTDENEPLTTTAPSSE